MYHEKRCNLNIFSHMVPMLSWLTKMKKKIKNKCSGKRNALEIRWIHHFRCLNFFYRKQCKIVKHVLVAQSGGNKIIYKYI